jgi:uncharacterized membrane protein
VRGWQPAARVLYSGIAEILLASGLIFANRRHQSAIGKLVALFFNAVFPGNVSQFLHQRDAFDLNSDGRRFVRLFFQPLLVYWALKSTQLQTQRQGPVERISLRT